MRRNQQDAAQGTRSPPGRTQVPATEPTSARTDRGPRQEAEIPVLDEIVVAPVPEPQAAGDDFPVLTDAVDEIDVALPASLDGEPSDWLVALADDQSVLGPSPPMRSRSCPRSTPGRRVRRRPSRRSRRNRPPSRPRSLPCRRCPSWRISTLNPWRRTSRRSRSSGLRRGRRPQRPWRPARELARGADRRGSRAPGARARQDAVPSTPPARPP